MLGKLAFRNMKRSARDYLVYILTMTMVAGLMYAFNSLIFQNELVGFGMTEEMDILAVMIGLATVFIVLIVAWLISYMVRFMLEKRSSEFGIYLLLGMKKKMVSRLYMRENLLLGGVCLLVGFAFGILLQQVLMAVMCAMVGAEFRLRFSFSKGTVLMTVLCYMGCFLLALSRCGRRLRKMNINSLMHARRRNEEIREKYEGCRKLLLPLSMVMILAFWVWFGRLGDTVQILLFLVGLVVTIYLFYLGLSAWIICYVRRRGRGIYKGQNLFLLRQFASKVRTMQFTMGTLTALFTLALMGASIALMFSSYENTMLEDKFPFDIQVFHRDPAYDFAAEKKVIGEQAQVSEYFSYTIYTDRTDQTNLWMLFHNEEWGREYWNEDGTPDIQAAKKMLREAIIYYTHDTYMGISTYNHLRTMLGYEPVSLGEGEYLVHVKSRLAGMVDDMEKELGESLVVRGGSLEDVLILAGICTEPFSQDGHNGADYLLIVPDNALGRLEPYYGELVADIQGEAPEGLQKALESLPGRDSSWYDAGGLCIGSDNIISYTDPCLVRDNVIPRMKYLLGSLIIPLFYMGLVFVCVAVTVLSVQQLSDSAKYKFRYDVLRKLGAGRSQIRRLVLKQLAAYYLCPALLGIVISGKMILYISSIFVAWTGVPAAPGGFFARSVGLFFGIYVVYFVVTYVGFKRNVEGNA